MYMIAMMIDGLLARLHGSSALGDYSGASCMCLFIELT